MAFTLVTPLCLHVNALKAGILPRSRHRLADFFFLYAAGTGDFRNNEIRKLLDLYSRDKNFEHSTLIAKIKAALM